MGEKVVGRQFSLIYMDLADRSGMVRRRLAGNSLRPQAIMRYNSASQSTIVQRNIAMDVKSYQG